ncbi:MAG: aspartate/glutamate racemase family protein [Pseudomonadota bacterium]
MLVMDSGLGGIAVVRALRAAQPGLPLHYLADTAGFPYGMRSTADITARASALIAQLAPQLGGGPVVLACNTLSTLCLDQLRGRFPDLTFIGTVPAVKVAAKQSLSRRFTLLATPNTAQSAYSMELIRLFADGCVVDSYGAPGLAAMAERLLLGDAPDTEALRAELAPAFHDDARGRTDCIVLGCTHYPLILDALSAVAPWPVTFIDSSDAIARHALKQPGTPPPHSIAYVTAPADQPRYRALFAREGFAQLDSITVS